MGRGTLILAGILSVLLSISITEAAHSYNITKILAQHPEFSTFNHYLTTTHLDNEINRRRTITVLAVDNSGMADLLAKHFTVPTLRNVLSLHILTDYYGAKKLHQLTGSSTVAASVYQSSGAAPGMTGYINITDHRAGKVSFSADDSGGASPASFVKSIKELPYDLSVIQISTILSSPEAEAPVAAPAPVNLTELMTSKGCKNFADLLVQYSVEKTFEDNLESGLTVFCPIDAAVKAFMAKFKNLTADGKTSLLLYHGLPVYYSIQLLKSNNGVVSTLATDGASKRYNYTIQNDGEVVTLKTKIVTAAITSTLIDQDPDAVYSIDKVLEPRELFKPTKEVIVDAPAPAPAAHKPKKHKPASKHASAPAPAGPEEQPADQEVADASAAMPTVAMSSGWAISTAVALAATAVWVAI